MASDFLPTMSLPEVNIPQMAPITFSTPTPRKTDMSLLMQSLRMQEAREERAVEQSKQFDTTAANLKKDLNPADYAWIDDRVANAKKDFEEEIARGNYSTAYKKAAAAGGMLARDSQILNRVTANKEYEQKKKEVDALAANGNISRETQDWWLHKNQYNYDDTSGRLAEMAMPINTTGLLEQWAISAKSLATEQRSQRLGSVPKTMSIGQSEQSYLEDSQSSYLSPETLRRNYKQIVENNGGFAALEQMYEVDMFAYEQLKAKVETAKNPNGTLTEEGVKLQQQLNKRKKYLYKNGSPIPYDQYFANKVTNNSYATSMAYNYSSSNRQFLNSSGGRGTGGTKSDVFSALNLIMKHMKTESGRSIMLTSDDNGNLSIELPADMTWESEETE
jgi:hypothetical protein